MSEVPPSPSPTFTCQDAPTDITLSTVSPTSLPATAPWPPNPPNTDERPLQTAPQALTGSLVQRHGHRGKQRLRHTGVLRQARLAAPVPTAGDQPEHLCRGMQLASSRTRTRAMYYLEGGTSPTVAEPGWAQFTATTTVVTLGLPVGPPAGFSF